MTAAQRTHLKANMDWHWTHRPSWDYPPGDQRTSRDGYSWSLTEQALEHYILGGSHVQMDCSEYGSWLLKSVGCWHWNAPGYTGSHLQTLPVYTNATYAEVGALVIFGPGTGEHEAVVYTPDPKGGNPVLQSHGRPGMDRPTLSTMAAYFNGIGKPGVRFCNVSHL